MFRYYVDQSNIKKTKCIIFYNLYIVNHGPDSLLRLTGSGPQIPDKRYLYHKSYIGELQWLKWKKIVFRLRLTYLK